MKQFEQMSKMMKMMQGPGGNLMKMMGGMKECQEECNDNIK
jgi:signal recognition particle subunit SRP54